MRQTGQHVPIENNIWKRDFIYENGEYKRMVQDSVLPRLMIDTLLGNLFYRCQGNLLLEHASLHLILKKSYFMTHYYFILHHTIHPYH